MALYTFYACTDGGTSETLVTAELHHDDEAQARSLHLLDRHPGADAIVVWCEERKVVTCHRASTPDVAASARLQAK
jgi:hypothetical protein